MYASDKTQEYPWWAGNARFIDLSNTFIVAHVAQAALIMLWAGSFTLFELAVYSSDAPLYTQGLILLPHLATEGWGIGSGGAIVDTSVWFSIGAIHIVAAAVLAGGAYFHYTRLPASLANAPNNAAKFHFEWQDAKKLGFILGHHLIFLALGALLLVAKAQYFGGLYDAYSDSVRVVASPTLSPAAIWDYRTHLFDVRSLEDLVGGHIYVAGLLIAGGIWHILVPPFQWVKRFFFFSGDGILSYSLFGIAIAGFAASYYCGFDSLAYPEKFYGPTLELKSSLLPRYYEVQPTMADGYTSRVWLANAHFYLAFFFLQGGLWHFQRAAGFNISNLLENWRRNRLVSSENPTLAYQHSERLQPGSAVTLGYGMPEAEPQPQLKIRQYDEDYIYRPIRRMSQTDLTTINGVKKTLYQTAYQSQKDRFYQSSKQDKSEAETLFGYGKSYSDRLYERPENLATKPPAYSRPIETTVYEPRLQ
ncbi:chlorophyll a/b binding light-harvesting protein [Romeria aff. gracilis LEGE 07310]|uniref:Chlorophyll a/b binding light-harvesting protein n=1 Tax=Vasconcelosia minhoensis LEGE 07310 TaxID=915328 RepID=A0A8J7AC45_9CYAN|nr:chlorophyll a/b binding light-harvesting protein [Romeria gracilis]MBE9077561.1 chlorophyll a/b binding light-harvesting protein [Romeria aff. gracilis LEGE 07310]